MCEFCESEKPVEVGYYSNSDSLDIAYGQYKGVHVYAELEIKKDMLLLSGRGNYRSASDCYYESEGLECDGEYSHNSKAKPIKIQYCPFCGRKIDSVEYEKELAERYLPRINKILDILYFWKDYAGVCWRRQDGKEADNEITLTKDKLIFDYPYFIHFDEKRYKIFIDWKVSDKNYEAGWDLDSVKEMPLYEKEEDLNTEGEWKYNGGKSYIRASIIHKLKHEDFNKLCRIKKVILDRNSFRQKVNELITKLEKEKEEFEKYI